MFSDQRLSLPTPTMVFSMYLIVIFLYLLQVDLYERSWYLRWLVHLYMWCFLFVYFISTLHSIKLWSCLPSSTFAWGQVRSKLGGSWYVHFASLFYIIICCYSLIYFIFGDDTYVISSILHDWWSLGDGTPESEFC